MSRRRFRIVDVVDIDNLALVEEALWFLDSGFVYLDEMPIEELWQWEREYGFVFTREMERGFRLPLLDRLARRWADAREERRLVRSYRRVMDRRDGRAS